MNDASRIDSMSQADAQMHCSECGGMDGRHYMTCVGNGAGIRGERAPIEGHDERDPAEAVGRKSLSQEEIADCFTTADKLFDGKKFEDGAVVDPDASDKLPPTADDMASNEMLWLIAKTCHEANRAYCREVILDHSHLPWNKTDKVLHLSAYDGVVKHFENPGLTPEQSHINWCEYKRAEGWVFGSMKDMEAKTHPCLLPYSQLHRHDRAKDHIFKAICNAMLGGAL